MVCLLVWIADTSAADSKTKKTTTFKFGRSKIKDIQASNISANLADWEQDLAIMFYAPWCKNCKQLSSSWEAIAGLVEDNKNLAIVRLNCEGEKENIKLCKKLEINSYPTVAFLGYGNFHQAPRGKLLGKPLYPQLVYYVADLYPEAIYDWILFLSSISSARRRWDDFVGIFTGQHRVNRKLQSLQKRVSEAERKAALFGNELEKYKANELFDSLEDHGDVFPLLHELEPDEQNLPLRVCVADMAAEFCQYYPEEKYCANDLSQCFEEQLASQFCRPKSCPFSNKRGCVVVSTCMKTSVLDEYIKSLRPSSSKL